MIKKLKIGLLVAVLSLAVVASSAFAADLTYSSDMPVNLSTSGYSMTIKSGSAATTAIVSGTALRVTLPISNTFTVTSTNAIDITTNSGASTNTSTCASNLYTTVITTSGAQTPDITLTPNGTICASSSGGGGGGGGSSYTAPAATYVAPATIATKVIQGCNGTAGYSTATGQSCQFNTGGITTTTPGNTANAAASPSSPSSSVAKYALGTVTLKNGSRGAAAKELQRFLNDKLALGLKLDGIIGPKTIAVIKKWQKENGLVADGLIGPKTKAMMNTQ